MYSLFSKSGIFRSERKRERERDVFCAIRSVPNLCVGSGLSEVEGISSRRAHTRWEASTSFASGNALDWGCHWTQKSCQKFWIFEIIQEITKQITSKALKWKMIVKKKRREMPPKKNGRSLVPCGKRALVEKWKALAWWLEDQILLKDMPSNYTSKFLVSCYEN